jgi:hypothetical protein
VTLVRLARFFWAARPHLSAWRPPGHFSDHERCRRDGSAGKRRKKPANAGPAAVSDTGRTPTQLRSDIIDLFSPLRPPIRERYPQRPVIGRRVWRTGQINPRATSDISMEVYNAPRSSRFLVADRLWRGRGEVSAVGSNRPRRGISGIGSRGAVERDARKYLWPILSLAQYIERLLVAIGMKCSVIGRKRVPPLNFRVKRW